MTIGDCMEWKLLKKKILTNHMSNQQKKINRKVINRSSIKSTENNQQNEWPSKIDQKVKE